MCEAKGISGDEKEVSRVMKSYLEGYADDLWDQIKAVNDNSRKAKLLGFVADTTPVVTNISQIANALSEFQDLNNGTAVDFDAKLAEYEKKMDKNER